jgi:hypothetical protein
MNDVVNSSPVAPTDKQQNASWFLTEAFVIAAITVVGCLLAFSFEAGFLWHFGVPSSLVELSTTQIIIGCVSVLVLYGATVPFLNIWLTLVRGFHQDFASVRALLLVFVPLLIFLWWVDSIWLWAIVILFVFFAAIYLLQPLLTQRDKPTYREKLRAQDEYDSKDQNPSILDRLLNLLPPAVRPAAFFLLLGVALAFPAGEGTASKQEYFWVNAANPNEVVVRVYNSRMICCEIDEHAEFKDQNFLVREIPSDLKLVNRKLGRLKHPKLPKAAAPISPTPSVD